MSEDKATSDVEKILADMPTTPSVDDNFYRKMIYVACLKLVDMPAEKQASAIQVLLQRLRDDGREDFVVIAETKYFPAFKIPFTKDAGEATDGGQNAQS